MSVNRQAIERHMLECGICMETYNNNDRQPRILPCQHTYCVLCLTKILVNDKIVCSQCRTTNDVPDINKLPKDNARRDLMDILQQSEKSNQICTMCDEGNVAVSYCQICDERMCEECTKAHRRMKATSKHSLVNTKTVTNQFNTDKTGDKSKADEGLKNQSFCLTCNKILQKCIEHHTVVSIEEGYRVKQHEIRQMVSALKAKVNENEIRMANEATVKENDGYLFLRDKLQELFKRYFDILKNREEKLLGQLNEHHSQNQKMLNQTLEDLSRHSSEVSNAISLAERICDDADKASFLESAKSSIEQLQRLSNFEVNSRDIQQLIFAEACTTDDFQRIIEAIGSFRTSSDIPNNYVVLAETVSRNGDPDSNAQSIQSILSSIESRQTEQLMEALKSINMSGYEYLPSTSIPSVRSERNAISYKETITSMKTDQFKTRITETGVPKGMAELLKYPTTRTVIQARFHTHKLQGDFTVEEGVLTVHANSEDEAEYCKQLVKESIFVKHVAVRPDAMFLVHSDKCLEVFRTQHQKYPEQISIDVLHDENKISVYSTSSIYVRDVHDAVTIFFRDNNVNIIYLKFNAKIVSRLLKQKKLLKKILTSWSHFCVDIRKHDDVTVMVKGIGIGLAHTVRSVNELAGKCTATVDGDDDRFDDGEDEDDDDDTRFDDLPVGNANVELKLKGVKAELKSLSLIGDDKVVFVFHGDVTELPVEAIVNPADKTLKHNGGLAKVLVKKGGRCIQDECRDYVNQHGDLQIGDVMCSGAGTLQSRIIAHVVGPKWIDGQHDEETQLQTAVYNSLLEAHKRMLVSVAIPAIGAGTFGFPLKVAARGIVRGIRHFFQTKLVSCIREVHLVDISTFTATCFVDTLKEVYLDADHIVSSVREEQQTRPPVLLL